MNGELHTDEPTDADLPRLTAEYHAAKSNDGSVRRAVAEGSATSSARWPVAVQRSLPL